MSKLLAHDHAKLNVLYYELCVALEARELTQILRYLDRFWAQLAVHIRAEHLVLFPVILGATTLGIQDGPSLKEAQATIKQLRSDHDFFMHELAQAIKTVRKLLESSDETVRREGQVTVEEIVARVAARLQVHNKREEEGIYVWAHRLLNRPEKIELAARVRAELEKMPPRFEC
jgi:hypothetical protein